MEKLHTVDTHYKEKEERGELIQKIVKELSNPESYEGVYHRSHHRDVSMPSVDALKDIVQQLKSILFPGYFQHSEITPESMGYYIGAALDRVTTELSEQIKRGYCFSCPDESESICQNCETLAREKTAAFIQKLPHIRMLLSSDACKAFDGDPAAKNIGEIIFCYPSILAVTYHRIAHELYALGVPLVPRIISEIAHSLTGIDIHPGAQIGERFFIDHGTGTVIGETCIIGNNVQIYQGVTLGAKSFPKDAEGNPIKGEPRHPIVEDDVTIYSGATILGRITVGKEAEIGGNVWITSDVAPGEHIYFKKVK